MSTKPTTIHESALSDSGNAWECAVIVPLSGDGNPSVTPFDRLYDDIIKPACELAGLHPYRIEAHRSVSPPFLQSLLNAPLAIYTHDHLCPNAHFLMGARAGAERSSIVMHADGTQVTIELPHLYPVGYRTELRYHEVVADQKLLASSLIQARSRSAQNEFHGTDAESLAIDEAEPDELDTRKMLQLIHYQLNALQAEIQMAVRSPVGEFHAETLAAMTLEPPKEDAPPLEQGEQSYLLARKLYANGASHKEIFTSLKRARNKLVDALRQAQESETASHIHELLQKTTEFEKYLLG